MGFTYPKMKNIMINEDKTRRELEIKLISLYLKPKPTKDNVDWLDSPEFQEFVKIWDKLSRYYNRVDTPFMSIDVLFVYSGYMKLFDSLEITVLGEEAYKKAIKTQEYIQAGFDEILRQGLMAIDNLNGEN